jgi:hypothetical protein
VRLKPHPQPHAPAAAARLVRPRVRVINPAVLVAMVLAIATMHFVPGTVKLAAPPGVFEAAADGVLATTGPRSSAELALAAALVDALNRGDEDAVVALFDPEATLHMDRYAWSAYQIRQWAHAQIAAGIVIESEGPFQAIANRALWTARVRRDDWRERGVESVLLANQILTEGDRILDFSADPLDGASVTPLSDLWRPGSPPDARPLLAQSRASNQARSHEQAAGSPLGLPLSSAFVPLVTGAAYRRRSGGLLAISSQALGARLETLAAPRWEGLRMRILLGSAILAATCIVLGSGASTAAVASGSAPASAGQQPDPTPSVPIVENFLFARNMGDFSAAAGWCASLLEVENSGGSWFLDAPTTRDWLRQLANSYVVEPLTHPLAESNTVAWTERLSPRGVPFPEALRSSISVQVHAVIRDGKIAYLSGPYPWIPFRSGSASGEPGLREGSMSSPAIPPFTLFVGSALGLAVAALLVNILGPLISKAVLRLHSRHHRGQHDNFRLPRMLLQSAPPPLSSGLPEPPLITTGCAHTDHRRLIRHQSTGTGELHPVDG